MGLTQQSQTSGFVEARVMPGPEPSASRRAHSPCPTRRLVAHNREAEEPARIGGVEPRGCSSADLQRDVSSSGFRGWADRGHELHEAGSGGCLCGEWGRQRWRAKTRLICLAISGPLIVVGIVLFFAEGHFLSWFAGGAHRSRCRGVGRVPRHAPLVYREVARGGRGKAQDREGAAPAEAGGVACLPRRREQLRQLRPHRGRAGWGVRAGVFLLETKTSSGWVRCEMALRICQRSASLLLRKVLSHSSRQRHLSVNSIRADGWSGVQDLGFCRECSPR
jgi:hypothetical protein